MGIITDVGNQWFSLTKFGPCYHESCDILGNCYCFSHLSTSHDCLYKQVSSDLLDLRKMAYYFLAMAVDMVIGKGMVLGQVLDIGKDQVVVSALEEDILDVDRSLGVGLACPLEVV